MEVLTPEASTLAWNLFLPVVALPDRPHLEEMSPRLGNLLTLGALFLRTLQNLQHGDYSFLHFSNKL